MVAEGPNIRRAAPADAPCLSRCHLASCDEAWTAETLERWLRHKQSIAFLAGCQDSGGPRSRACRASAFASGESEDECCPSGLIIALEAAGEAEILTFAVHPLARRLGLGRRLLDAVVAELKERQTRRLFLEVATDNTAARCLYEGAGFLSQGVRKGYYARPAGVRVDAIVMSLALCDETGGGVPGSASCPSVT